MWTRMTALIDGEKLMRDLDALLATWKAQASMQGNEKPEWTRGVVYGITISMRYLFSKLPLLIVIPLLSLAACKRCPSPTAAQETGTAAYIIGGQSNMTAEDQSPKFPDLPNLVCQGNCTNAGMGYAFAYDKAAYNPNLQVYVLNCAIGGTYIAVQDESIVPACLDNNHAALEQFHANLRAFIFEQGENDGVGTVFVDWKGHFENIIQTVRSKTRRPDLKIIYGQLGKVPSTYFGNQWDIIKAQQADVQASNTVMFQTDDQDYNPGTMHFTYQAYQVLGLRIFNLESNWDDHGCSDGTNFPTIRLF